MKREDYKAGDAMRVMGLPDGLEWTAPSGRLDLKNGDIITLADPPVTGPFIENPHIAHDFILRFTSPPSEHGMSLVCWIYPQWVERLEDAPDPCRCDIMVTGCVCGAFQRERGGSTNGA